MYVKLPDPYNGQKMIAEAHRSDGKLIKTENTEINELIDQMVLDAT